MVNSVTSFYKHLDQLLKLLDPAYTLQVGTELKTPGYTAYAYHTGVGTVQGEIFAYIMVDQYVLRAEKRAELRAALEREHLLDMLGLLGNPKENVQAKYSNLNAYLSKWLGGIYLPKFKYINNDGSAGDQVEVCMMRVSLLGENKAWEEWPTAGMANDLYRFRLHLVLHSYSL